MLICKDCGRKLNKGDACCPECGSENVVLDNYSEPYTFKTAFKSLFTKVANFKGRSGRSEFWKAFGMNILATIVFIVLVGIVGLVVIWPTLKNIDSGKMTEMDVISFVFAGICAVAAVVYCVVIAIGWIAMFVRRLHDSGKTGKLALLIVIPGIGLIALLLMALMNSQPEINKYGSNPKVKMGA